VFTDYLDRIIEMNKPKSAVRREYLEMTQHLRKAVLTEGYHSEQGGGYAQAKPVAAICSHYLSTYLNDLKLIDDSEKNPDVKRVELAKLTDAELTLAKETIQNLCGDDSVFTAMFDVLACWQTLPEPDQHLPWTRGLVIHRFFLKNRISIGHIDCSFKASLSQSSHMFLSFSMYHAHNSLWALGGDILRFGTKINKSLQVKYFEDPNFPDARLDIPNKCNLTDVIEVIKNEIPGGVANLKQLKKGILFARDKRMYISGDESIMLSRFPDDVNHVHLLCFASNKHHSPLAVPANKSTFVAVGVFANDVWCPYVGTNISTLDDLLKYFLEVFIGGDPDKTGVNENLLLGAIEFATRLDYNTEATAKFAKDQLQKMPLTTLLSEIKSQLLQIDKAQPKPFKLDVGGKSAEAVREVDVICFLKWEQIKPQNKFINEGNLQLYEQLKKFESQKSSPQPAQIEPPLVDTQVKFKCRVQTVKQLDLLPKLSSVIEELLDVESRIPICEKKTPEDYHHYFTTMKDNLKNALGVTNFEMAEMKKNMRNAREITEIRHRGVKLGFGFLFPAIYCVNVVNISSSIDSFADLEFESFADLEQDKVDYVSVRYRPIGMIFQKSVPNSAALYNILEICAEQLQVVQKFPEKVYGNLFEREYRRITNTETIVEPSKAPAKDGKPAVEVEAFDANKIVLTEIQKSRLVTYYKYHGSTYDKTMKKGTREPVKCLLKHELHKLEAGILETIIFEKKPVE
jgi:hypothetical protein